MNIWIYTHLRDSPSVSLLAQAGRARGHRTIVVHPEMVAPAITAHRTLEVKRLAGSLDALPDIVIPRIGSSAPQHALLSARHFEQLDVPMLNSTAALEASRDKFRSAQLLALDSIAVPHTTLFTIDKPSGVADLEPLITKIGPPPWVVKSALGFQGEEVVLVESPQQLLATAHALTAPGNSLLIQEFIRESSGRDTRVIVIEGRAVAAMDRTARSGEFRANLHQGGSAERRILTPEVADIAQRAAKRLGLDVAGVDLIESTRGFLVLEVNGSPGLSGIERATGVKCAERVISLAEKRLESPS